jgi:hypothetical protein
MIRAIHEEASREHNRLVAEAREAREQAVASTESKVFAISYPERATASEKALIALSYRDARDRAERAASDRENPDALEDLLDRAEKPYLLRIDVVVEACHRRPVFTAQHDHARIVDQV